STTAGRRGKTTGGVVGRGRVSRRVVDESGDVAAAAAISGLCGPLREIPPLEGDVCAASLVPPRLHQLPERVALFLSRQQE
ncbi:hypothetical protein U9M48_017524, partial [Paspalum notatum var. saurae]